MTIGVGINIHTNRAKNIPQPKRMAETLRIVFKLSLPFKYPHI